MKYNFETQEMIQKIPLKVTLWNLVITTLIALFIFALSFLKYPTTSSLAILEVGHESSDNVKITFLLPELLIGTVDVNQSVIIELNEFPVREFGVLRGQITKIDSANNNHPHKAYIVLPSKLITTYGNIIHLSGGMSGVVKVYSGRKRLINWIAVRID